MIVWTQKKGRFITGLRIGTSNVQRYFRAGIDFIDMQLDHLCIRCKLQASFWRDRPDISDPRLCAWLQSKFEKLSEIPVSLEMIQEGDSYRLTLLGEDVRADRAAPAQGSTLQTHTRRQRPPVAISCHFL